MTTIEGVVLVVFIIFASVVFCTTIWVLYKMWSGDTPAGPPRSTPDAPYERLPMWKSTSISYTVNDGTIKTKEEIEQIMEEMKERGELLKLNPMKPGDTRPCLSCGIQTSDYMGAFCIIIPTCQKCYDRMWKDKK